LITGMPDRHVSGMPCRHPSGVLGPCAEVCTLPAKIGVTLADLVACTDCQPGMIDTSWQLSNHDDINQYFEVELSDPQPGGLPSGAVEYSLLISIADYDFESFEGTTTCSGSPSSTGTRGINEIRIWISCAGLAPTQPPQIRGVLIQGSAVPGSINSTVAFLYNPGFPGFAPEPSFEFDDVVDNKVTACTTEPSVGYYGGTIKIEAV